MAVPWNPMQHSLGEKYMTFHTNGSRVRFPSHTTTYRYKALLFLGCSYAQVPTQHSAKMSHTVPYSLFLARFILN